MLSKVTDFLASQGGQSVTNGISLALDAYSSLIDRKHTDTGYEGQQAIGNVLLQSPDPIMKTVGAAYKGLSMIGEATGLNSNQLSSSQASTIGVKDSGKFLNNLASYVPMLGAAGVKTGNSEKSIEIDKIRGAYTGTAGDIDTAETLGDRRYLVGGKKANKFINEQNQRNKLLTYISLTNTLRKQSDFTQELNSQNFNRYNGNNYQSTAIGKEGLKLPDKELLARIYSSRKPKENIPEFKDGGVIGIDSNVIPEGALHKELNHMEEHNEELDKVITDKGIAVVVTDEDGKPEQVAEIEKEEIVLRKKLTKVIEELWKDGSEEAMLKAGKLLAKEIIGNTDDNTEEMLDGDN